MDKCKSMDDWKKALSMYEHKGVVFNWLTPPHTWDELKDFHVREDDVFIITYPKSGSHWLMEIVQLLQNDAQTDKVDRSNLDTALEITLSNPGAEDSQTAIPGYKRAEEWSSPRVILTHCFEHLLPLQVWTKKPKVIYLMRNPKDAAVSAFNFIPMLLPPFLKDLNEYIKYFLTEQYWGGSWFKQVLGYLPHQKDDNFLFVKYEDLHANLKGEIARINEHLGRPLSTDKLDQMVELSSFSGMQKSYADSDKLAAEKGDKSVSQSIGDTPYLRKGKIGQWRGQISAEVNEEFDRVYKENMGASGLHLQFE